MRDVTVFEAMAQHDDFNEVYVEIIAPTEVLYSPEFDDVTHDFADATHHVRDHVVPLEDMTQILTR